jgi:hypothetical protein
LQRGENNLTMQRLLANVGNFTWLLAALVFLLFSSALLAQLELREGQRLVNIILMFSILAAAWTVESERGRWLKWKIGMSLIIAVMMISDSIIESNFLAIYQLAFLILFLVFALYLCWQHVMFSGEIDGNKIVGAVCIYLILGLVWAFAYLMVAEIFQTSFGVLTYAEWQKNLGDAVYFSMVTLTTLGYGDITPKQPVVRFMAFMEAVTGVFYTTVLVASLIGMRLASFNIEQNNGPGAQDD